MIGHGEVCPLGPFYLPAYAEGVRAGLRELGPHLLGETAPIVCQGEVRHARMLPAQTPRGLAMPYRKEIHDLSLPAQTLSASVERTPAEAASCPHRQPVISGISSPYRAMNSLWSMSLSRIACLA